MPQETTAVPVGVRISSYQIGDRQNPRYVWSVGVPAEFLDQIPSEQRRIRLRGHNGILCIHFANEGIKISLPNRGKVAWAGSIGQHHISGIQLPDETARSVPAEGIFHPDKMVIEVSRNLPEIVERALREVEVLEQASDPKIHFPAQHFQEDLAEAAGRVQIAPTEPLQGHVDTHAPAEQEHTMEPSSILPVNLENWTDDEVRRLRELVRDMMAQRSDIVITMEGDSVRFQKQILTDL